MVVSQNKPLWNRAIGLGMLGLLTMPSVVAVAGDRASISAPGTAYPKPAATLARTFACPTDLAPLTTALLRDLPSYINRANAQLGVQQPTESTYAVIASQPDFTPLPTGSSEYQAPPDPNLHQVFFTVLERQYVGKRVLEFQQYHWLFLTQTTAGWQLALLFSHIGSYPHDRQPITP